MRQGEDWSNDDDCTCTCPSSRTVGDGALKICKKKINTLGYQSFDQVHKYVVYNTLT